MDKKQQITIPKFLWVLAGILVVCIIFLIAIQIPFSGKIDKYEKDHASATSQIDVYKDYLERHDAVTKSIDNMKEECSKMDQQLTINASKTVDDISAMLKSLDYDPSSLSVTEGKVDSKGGVSANGDPLCVTTIRFAFTSTEKKLIDTLRYFETKSQGAYFISKLSISEDKKTVGETSAGAASQQSISAANKLYVCNLEIQLYYFDASKNTKNKTSSGSSKTASSSSSKSSK